MQYWRKIISISMHITYNSSDLFSTDSKVSRPLRLEDPLEYLPCSAIIECPKGMAIYRKGDASTALFLVISGRVAVSRTADDGRQVLLDIYQQDEFFGEGTFAESYRSESAVALDEREADDLDQRGPRRYRGPAAPVVDCSSANDGTAIQ